MKCYRLLAKYILTSVIVIMAVCIRDLTADAILEPIRDSKGATIIGTDGTLVSGQPISTLKPLIPLRYRGTDIDSDVTINGLTGQTNKTFPANAVVKVHNVGFYKGKPLVFCFKLNGNIQVNAFPEALRVNVSPPYKSDLMEYLIWVEDSQGNEILDNSINFLLPYRSGRLNVSIKGDFLMNFFNNQSISNIAVIDNSSLVNIKFEKVSNNEYNIRQTRGSNSIVDFNIIYTPAKERLWISKSLVNSNDELTNDAELFLNKLAPTLAATANPAPDIIETKNTTSFKAKVNLSQVVSEQGFESFYSNPMNVTILMPKIVKTVNNTSKLTIIDKDKNNITAKSVISSPTDGTLQLEFNKTLLQSLKDNVVTIQGDFDLNTAAATDLINYYQSDGYFHLPITAKNSDTKTENSGFALVKMPLPTGEAIPQSVGLNTSTKDLDASKLVKNLKSILSTDTITVTGFDQDKTFATLGDTEVYVTVKSGLTGVEGKVKVPVKVSKQYKLTVNFVDEKGQVLQNAYTKDEVLGTKIDLSKLAEINTVLTKLKNENYNLTKKPANELITIVEGENNYTYQFTGVLKILSAPTVLNFDIQKATINAVKYTNPKIIGSPLVISDTRADRMKWNLKAKVDQPLTNLENRQAILPDSIKYKYMNNDLTLTAESNIIFSYLNPVSGSYDVTKERWAKGDGFYLDLKPGSIRALGKYQAKVTVTLENAK